MATTNAVLNVINTIDEAHMIHDTALPTLNVTPEISTSIVTQVLPQVADVNRDEADFMKKAHGRMENGHKAPRPPLSDEELTQVLDDMMGKLDTSADGLISQEEFVAGRPQAKAADKIFGRFDVDGDGNLNTDEFAASQMMKFLKDSFPDMKGFHKFLEANGIAKDAVVTREQAEALRDARIDFVDEMPQGKKPQGPEGRGPKPHGGKPGNGMPGSQGSVQDAMAHMKHDGPREDKPIPPELKEKLMEFGCPFTSDADLEGMAFGRISVEEWLENHPPRQDLTPAQVAEIKEMINKLF